MSGIAPSSLAVLAPLTPGASPALLGSLAELGDDPQRSPFARVTGTHVGRFAHVPVLTGKSGEPLDAAGSFLLMCADFDPSVAEWTAALCARSGSELDAVMGHCQSFPGSAHPDAVTEYFVAHNAPPGFTVPGYRRARVDEIREALRLRRALGELALRAQQESLRGTALREAWRVAVRG